MGFMHAMPDDVLDMTEHLIALLANLVWRLEPNILHGMMLAGLCLARACFAVLSEARW